MKNRALLAFALLCTIAAYEIATDALGAWSRLTR